MLPGLSGSGEALPPADITRFIEEIAPKHDQKGGGMTASEAAPGNGKAGPPPFDTSKAHQSRMYDYLLGGCSL